MEEVTPFHWDLRKFWTAPAARSRSRPVRQRWPKLGAGRLA